MSALVRECWNCLHYLGDGNCRLNLEKECAAGDDPAAWEPRDDGEVEA